MYPLTFSCSVKFHAHAAIAVGLEFRAAITGTVAVALLKLCEFPQEHAQPR